MTASIADGRQAADLDKGTPMLRVLLAVLLLVWLVSCGKAGGSYVGSWINPEDPQDIVVIDRNGDGFLVTTHGKRLPAAYGDGVLKIAVGMGELMATHIEKSDTVLMAAPLLGQVEYQRLTEDSRKAAEAFVEQRREAKRLEQQAERRRLDAHEEERRRLWEEQQAQQRAAAEAAEEARRKQDAEKAAQRQAMAAALMEIDRLLQSAEVRERSVPDRSIDAFSVLTGFPEKRTLDAHVGAIDSAAGTGQGPLHRYARVDGRPGVFVLHPVDPGRSGLLDLGKLTSRSAGEVLIAMRSHPSGDAALVIRCGSREVARPLLTGGEWTPFRIPYDHEPVTIEALPGQWFWEHALIQLSVVLTPESAAEMQRSGGLRDPRQVAEEQLAAANAGELEAVPLADIDARATVITYPDRAVLDRQVLQLQPDAGPGVGPTQRFARLFGRPNVCLVSPPRPDTAGIIDLSAITTTRIGRIVVAARNHPEGNCEVRLRIGGEIVDRVNVAANEWETIAADFSKAAVSIEVPAGDFFWEHAFLQFAIIPER